MTTLAGKLAVSPTVDVTTRLFGPLSVPVDAVIHFPRGLPGFPDATRFVLLDAGAPALQWLQSLDQPALCFLTAPATRVIADAWVEFPGALVIVTLPSATAPASANMRAPLLIDRTSGTGHQWIPVDCRYRTVHPFDLPAMLQSPGR
jgi:flagellar assembly factor FliW